ncbi:MAG: hypothetical protein RIG63_17025, partial [Coleofasciculus chthonoplastes F3-SA18-01]
MLRNKHLKDWSKIVSSHFSHLSLPHPFLRINHQGHYQLRCDPEWRCLDTVAPKTGTQWSGYVTCFKNHSLECTLLARWDEGYKEPWL